MEARLCSAFAFSRNGKAQSSLNILCREVTDNAAVKTKDEVNSKPIGPTLPYLRQNEAHLSIRIPAKSPGTDKEGTDSGRMESFHFRGGNAKRLMPVPEGNFQRGQRLVRGTSNRQQAEGSCHKKDEEKEAAFGARGHGGPR
jgi:hypothetical protein